MKKIIYSFTLLMGMMTFTACSSDSGNNGDDNNQFDIVKINPIVDQDNYSANIVAANYSNKTFGMTAIDGCIDLVGELEAANAVIASSKLSEAQEAYLRKVLETLVSNVIVPTYTKLADETEALESTLNGLTVNTITQAQINSACDDFKQARKYWEQSEAFLMGAASDFDVDPTIDSWPLNRTLLLSYFNNGMNEEMLEDATILGFHALEFILFRDGQPRKVAELQGNDTYKNFENVSGAKELAYAQTICKLLKERCFQLQCAWDGGSNSSRLSVVKAAGLDYQTEKGLSYADNLIKAGVSGSNSTFTSLKSAIAQVLSNDEGSCVAIANEVGTAKITNPFAAGDWFKLTISGSLNGTPVNTKVDFMLAQDTAILTQWAYVDLSTLGEVDELSFSMSGSRNGDYGLNTPSYFCIDNLGAEAPTHEAIENTNVAVKAVKVIRDGKVVILRGEKAFNILGSEL